MMRVLGVQLYFLQLNVQSINKPSQCTTLPARSLTKSAHCERSTLSVDGQ
jgi:hypothetical protein